MSLAAPKNDTLGRFRACRRRPAGSYWWMEAELMEKQAKCLLAIDSEVPARMPV